MMPLPSKGLCHSFNALPPVSALPRRRAVCWLDFGGSIPPALTNVVPGQRHTAAGPAESTGSSIPVFMRLAPRLESRSRRGP